MGDPAGYLPHDSELRIDSDRPSSRLTTLRRMQKAIVELLTGRFAAQRVASSMIRMLASAGWRPFRPVTRPLQAALVVNQK
jgi:hypothetical protein